MPKKTTPPSPILVRLEAMRIVSMLSRRELAGMAGLSQQTAQDALRWGRCNMATAEALAGALGLRMELVAADDICSQK